MKEAIINFIKSEDLSPFNRSKTSIRTGESIYKTRDAKSIHTKTLSKLSQNFHFTETSNILHFFEFTNHPEIVKKRQEFFQAIPSKNANFLKNLRKPKPFWKPRYDVIAVTEDEQTFIKLNELGCTTQLLVSETDVMDLEKYDLVQVIDCEKFSRVLEKLPQSIFVETIDNVYLERYLEKLSGWKEIIELVQDSDSTEELRTLTTELQETLNLIFRDKKKIITREEVEDTLESINEKISEKIKEHTISGDSLIKILGEGKLPESFQKTIESAIQESGLPHHIFNTTIPVTIDEKELEDHLRRQSANEFTNMAEEIKRSAEQLKKIPNKIEQLSALILLEDFQQGIKKFSEKKSYPEISEEIQFDNIGNHFLENPQPVSFKLVENEKCSILTGANSGGKTTLLEHIIQIISLSQIGLPVSGQTKLPLFTDVYYFAKNKGSASKGAFETLLTQMSKIKPGNKTLILADEIEAVTEPGVAGEIIAATAEYFINQNCFLVIATHLGHEIKKSLPQKARIDGIEAKGLDENFELIIDHNPVLGRLAYSTPELIVEKMANTLEKPYFKHINNFLKKRTQNQ